MKPRLYWDRKYGWLPREEAFSWKWWLALRLCTALDRLNPTTPET